MSSVRVDGLDLKLLAPAAMRPVGATLKAGAEQRFVPAVLTAMERRLDRVYGSKAVIWIRRLRIRCSLRPAELDESRFAEQIGEDLAAYVEQLVHREHGSGPLPSAQADAQVYRDGAHVEAAEIIAAAAGTAGLSGTREDFGRLWTRLVRSKPAHVCRVLERCLEAKRLQSVLARLDDRALAALEPVVAASRITALAARVAAARAARSPMRSRTAAPAAAAAAPASENGRPVRSRRKPAKRSARTASSASATPDARPRAPEVAGEAEPAPKRAPVEATPKVDSDRADRRAPAEPPARSAGQRPAVGAAKPAPVAASPSRAGSATGEYEPDPPTQGELTIHPSDWCALLYLVNVSQRLGLPERLWQVGADEGAVLASAFARLGAGDDPAARLLSAAFPDPPPSIAALPRWARDELRVGATGAAARLLGRPAEELAVRIGELEAWFGPGPGFDLAGWCAACHVAVAEAMLGTTFAPGALADRFARPGRIEAGADGFRVVQPLEAVDIDIRRAGLDADPGLLPWLGKTLRFDFEGEEA